MLILIILYLMGNIDFLRSAGVLILISRRAGFTFTRKQSFIVTRRNEMQTRPHIRIGKSHDLQYGWCVLHSRRNRERDEFQSEFILVHPICGIRLSACHQNPHINVDWQA